MFVTQILKNIRTILQRTGIRNPYLLGPGHMPVKFYCFYLWTHELSTHMAAAKSSTRSVVTTVPIECQGQWEALTSQEPE